MAEQRKVAFVTGGSRGIGKACALHLAARGLDVVVCSRTLKGDEVFNFSPTVKEAVMTSMEGSLEQAAQEAEQFGVRALPVKMDLLSRKDIESAVRQALDHFGRIDVLVNSGRYYGPGQQDLFVDTDMDIFDKAIQGNVLAPMQLIKLVMPSMTKNGGGVIINLTSASGRREVAAMPGKGGWGLTYSITKAGDSRAVPGLAKELRERNIAVIGLSPGNTATERRIKESGRYGLVVTPQNSLTPEIAGSACAYLATHPNVMFFSGREFESLDLCIEHQLVDVNTIAPVYGPKTWGLPRG